MARRPKTAKRPKPKMEQNNLAPSTINVRLAAVRRLAWVANRSYATP